MALPGKNGARLFTVEDLESGKLIRTLDVKIGELTMRVRHMTGQEFLDYIAEEKADAEAVEEARKSETELEPSAAERSLQRAARMLSVLAVDKDGNRALTDAHAETLLRHTPASVLTEAMRRAFRATSEEMTQAGEK